MDAKVSNKKTTVKGKEAGSQTFKKESAVTNQSKVNFADEVAQTKLSLHPVMNPSEINVVTSPQDT